MKTFFGWNLHLGNGFAARCEAVALPRRLAALTTWAMPLVRASPFGSVVGPGFRRGVLNSKVRQSVNDSSMRWQTYSVVGGKARTRGPAQEIPRLVGGAQPPPHIRRQSRGVVWISAVIVLVLAQTALAQDWSQWRGPTRNGVVPAASAPASWPESLRRMWRVEIGEGYSSPVVSGSRAFVHSRRDPDEIVVAINLANGHVLWQQKYAANFQKNQYAVKMAKGPNSTPMVIGQRLFTLGATGILTAWDTSTGRQLWRKDFSNTVDTSKLFCGTSASPLAFAGRLVVQVGSDVHGGQIIGLDPATGANVWTWKGLGPGYASPVVIEVAGRRQLVALTEGSIVGIDAKTGQDLWSMPFPDAWHENIMTPLWTGSHLVISGPRQGTHAYTLTQTAGKWQAIEAWKNADVAMYMSSPVYGDGLIYGHSAKRKGQFVALDEKTGVARWTTEGREGDNASVLLTPHHIVYLTNGADLIVARRATPTFSVERRYDVADAETWAIPVLLGTDVLVRDATGLIRLTPGQ